MEAVPALVVIDYQNIHLTARDVFAPHGTPAHECLVHPLQFAQQVLGTRQHRITTHALANPGTPPVPPAQLAAVHVFRGAPSNKEQPNLYRYSQAQRSEWTRDRRVTVEYRTLRYFWEAGVRVAQEKGIDVRVALDLVKSAMDGSFGLVILASHDTDLEPALESAIEWSDGVTVETAGWAGCRVLHRSAGLRHTSLDGAAFVSSRDRKIYQ